MRQVEPEQRLDVLQLLLLDVRDGAGKPDEPAFLSPMTLEVLPTVSEITLAHRLGHVRIRRKVSGFVEVLRRRDRFERDRHSRRPYETTFRSGVTFSASR